MNTISVVMASYNGEAYITKQLDSLRNQTRCIDEVILYDDGSRDQTVSIIKEYIVTYALPWKLFIQEKNIGYIRNFASGLRKANKDLVFLCDQDDIWDIQKVETLARLFEENPAMMCVNTSFQYIDACDCLIEQAHQDTNYGMLWNPITPLTCKEIQLEEIVYHNVSMGCTMAFRSSIKDQYLAHSTLQAPHDWEINRIAAIQSGLYFFQDTCMQYRIHENNTTGNDNVNGRSAGKRAKNAQTMYLYTKSYEPYRNYMNQEQLQLCDQLQIFCKHRVQLLQEHKKRHWFYLLCHMGMYRKIVSYQGMLADFLNK